MLTKLQQEKFILMEIFLYMKTRNRLKNVKTYPLIVI